MSNPGFPEEITASQMRRFPRSLFERLSGRGTDDPDIRPGASYRRKHGSNLVETAEVTEICRDHEGIPHVRFELRFGWPRHMLVAPQSRLLSLHEFASRYRDPAS